MWWLLVVSLSIFFEYSTCSDLLQCQYATSTKYLGYFSKVPGAVDGIPFSFSQENRSVICMEKCRRDRHCYALSYNSRMECRFYNTTFVRVQFDNSYDNSVYVWLRCNWNSWSKSPADGRCTGMFIGYVDIAATVRSEYLLLATKSGIYQSQCLEECVANPICKIVNYNYLKERRCLLYQGWPSYYVNAINSTGMVMHRWTCIPTYYNTVISTQVPSSKPNPVKCAGRWNLTDISKTNKTGAFFNTQSLENCLEECNKNLFCIEVLYNMTESACILPGIDVTIDNQYTIDFTLARFKWVCERNDSKYPPENDKEQRLLNLGLRCVTIVKNLDLYISEDHCGRPGTFLKCGQASDPGEWRVGDTCLLGQTFWKFKDEKSTLNKTGSDMERISKIFTGLTSFWLIYVDETTFNDSNYLECRRFDSSLPNAQMKEEEIISRERWWALKPYGDPGKQPNNKPSTEIIIDSSEIPYFGCRTIMTCSSILRNLQIRYFKGIGPIPWLVDSPYNFMLDENGAVYEVRGWKQRCAAFPNKPDSFCFAFIGSFRTKLPTVEFLNGVKKLIDLAVRSGHVDKNYTIMIYDDATILKRPNTLTLIVKNWFRYRGYIPKDCAIMSLQVLFGNLLAMAGISIIFFGIYSRFFIRKRCVKCEFLHDMNFTKIFPGSRDYISTYKEIFLTKYCIVTEKSSRAFQNKPSQVALLVKSWLLNMHLECFNIKEGSNHLGHVINLSKPGQTLLQVFESSNSNHYGKSKKIYTILYFMNENSFPRFTKTQENKDCICDRFLLELHSFPQLEFIND